MGGGGSQLKHWFVARSEHPAAIGIIKIGGATRVPDVVPRHVPETVPGPVPEFVLEFVL